MGLDLDLERQLVFYGAYHNDKWNKRIHFVFVPILLWTYFLMGTCTPALVDIPYLPLNLGVVSSFIYILLYLSLEPVAGGILMPIIIAGTIYANKLTDEYGMKAFKYALGVFIFSWIVQFYGHGAHEKRAPALLDNLFQAFFLAPFFVWFELLFFLGYRPELQSRVENKVGKEILKYRQSQAAKRSASDVSKAANGTAVNGKAMNGHAQPNGKVDL